jgi:hypothetical protein
MVRVLRPEVFTLYRKPLPPKLKPALFFPTFSRTPGPSFMDRLNLIDIEHDLPTVG